MQAPYHHINNLVSYNTRLGAPFVSPFVSILFRSAIERWRLEDPSLEGRSQEVQGWAPGRASSGFHLRHTQRDLEMGPKRAGEAVVAKFETLFFVFFFAHAVGLLPSGV